MDKFNMVAKNNVGAEASPDSLANASTHQASPLGYFGEFDEVTEHPNELLRQQDELQDMVTPEQTYEWLIDHDFPLKFAQSMRVGEFNGAATLDLFGCASTIKEALEMFKEFELSMPCLLQVWGSACARAEAAGSGNERNNTAVASDVTAGVNNGRA